MVPLTSIKQLIIIIMKLKLTPFGEFLNRMRNFPRQFNLYGSLTQVQKRIQTNNLSEYLLALTPGIPSREELNLVLLPCLLLMLQVSFAQGDLNSSYQNFKVGIGGTYGMPIGNTSNLQSESHGAGILFGWDAISSSKLGNFAFELNLGWSRRTPDEIDQFCRLNPQLCPFCFTGLSCPPDFDLGRNSEWIITPGLSWTPSFLQTDQFAVRVFGRGGIQYKEGFAFTASYDGLNINNPGSNHNNFLVEEIESQVNGVISPVIAYGIGLNFRLNDRIGLFAEARYDRFFDRNWERSKRTQFNTAWGDPYPQPSLPGAERSYFNTFSGINIFF